jgi:hypothetical protein
MQPASHLGVLMPKCNLTLLECERRSFPSFFARKPVERPKESRLSEISDTGHSWAAGRHLSDHFDLWLGALR